FFSSRRRHTRFSRDWSSDVCSSDLCAICKASSYEIKMFGVAFSFSWSFRSDFFSGSPFFNEEGAGYFPTCASSVTDRNFLYQSNDQNNPENAMSMIKIKL